MSSHVVHRALGATGNDVVRERRLRIKDCVSSCLLWGGRGVFRMMPGGIGVDTGHFVELSLVEMR